MFLCFWYTYKHTYVYAYTHTLKHNYIYSCNVCISAYMGVRSIESKVTFKARKSNGIISGFEIFSCLFFCLFFLSSLIQAFFLCIFLVTNSPLFSCI